MSMKILVIKIPICSQFGDNYEIYYKQSKSYYIYCVESTLKRLILFCQGSTLNQLS